ncbi:MAG TPA: VOC family protein [Dongiaceae bacterium]
MPAPLRRGTLAGQRFLALNGGERAEYTHAFSLEADCDDQAECDRLWDSLIAGGGAPMQCGWLRDRYAVSWQVVPRAPAKMLANRDAAKAQRVMDAVLQMVKLAIAALTSAYEGKAPR